jgi:hypothetical protein
MLMSLVIPTDVNVDFDLVEFWPVWEFDQNAINFTYDVRLRKHLYGRNQHDETYTITLVPSDSKNFVF